MRTRALLLAFGLGATGALAAERLVQDRVVLPGPQPEHAVLAGFAGRWKAVTTLHTPDGEKLEMPGEEWSRLLCDGTWLFSRMESDSLGATYEGLGLFGYDARERRYVGLWVDAQSGGLEPLEGDWDASSRTLTLHGRAPDPEQGGRVVPSRSVWRLDPPDARSFALHLGEGDKERLVVETRYERLEGDEAAASAAEARQVPALLEERAQSGRAYLPFLDRKTLSAGLYVLPVDGTDGQSPHALDELYYVLSGKAVLAVEGEDHPCGPGDVLFVAAGASHRFHSIEEELELLVFFSKATP